MQELAPTAAECCPLEQLLHFNTDAAPVLAWYVPAGHTEHEVDAALAWYIPLGQVSHAVEPATGA